VSFRVILDEGLCELHGECVMAAPKIFDIVDDDDDHVTLLRAEVDDALRPAAQDAVDNCPMSALRLEP
jgi:ferredoxin